MCCFLWWTSFFFHYLKVYYFPQLHQLQQKWRSTWYKLKFLFADPNISVQNSTVTLVLIIWIEPLGFPLDLHPYIPQDTSKSPGVGHSPAWQMQIHWQSPCWPNDHTPVTTTNLKLFNLRSLWGFIHSFSVPPLLMLSKRHPFFFPSYHVGVKLGGICFLGSPLLPYLSQIILLSSLIWVTVCAFTYLTCPFISKQNLALFSLHICLSGFLRDLGFYLLLHLSSLLHNSWINNRGNTYETLLWAGVWVQLFLIITTEG